MDFDDLLDELKDTQMEIEKSNGNRETYINRELIFSARYITAVKYLGENRYVSKSILDAARAMLEHHHGDKYEDLYFIDSETNKVLSRCDYRVNEQEVLPTAAMKEMARNSRNIICVHNHPTNALPSYEDLKTCHSVKYKYGLIVCHNGSIFQYQTIKDIDHVAYNFACYVYYKKEWELSESFRIGRINKSQFKAEHDENFLRLSGNFFKAGAMIKEVLWNEDCDERRKRKSSCD